MAKQVGSFMAFGASAISPGGSIRLRRRTFRAAQYVRRFESGVGSWKLGVGSWELEVGSWELRNHKASGQSIGKCCSLLKAISYKLSKNSRLKAQSSKLIKCWNLGVAGDSLLPGYKIHHSVLQKNPGYCL